MSLIPWRTSLLSAAIGGTMLLASCASVPDLGSRPVPRPASSFVADRSLRPAQALVAWPQADWWTAYGDPQLSALIVEGLQGSPDLAAAAARLRSAQAYAEQAGAALVPTVDAQAQAGSQKQSYNQGVPAQFVPHGWKSTGQAAVALSFDLDLWGRNRAALAAATSDAEAAKVDLAQGRLLLTTNIATAYADLARFFAEREVQLSALQIRAETLRLVSDRVQIGLDTRAELKQAEAAVPAARADLAATDEAIALTRNRIAALLGAGPDRGIAIARPAVGRLRALGLPKDITLNLVGRRPDVAAARARVEAAASRIKVARTDFYPAVNVSALIGLQSLGLSNLIQGSSVYGNAGPAISLPIFHGGGLQGRYRVVRAGYDEAVAVYDKAVAEAFHDVADAATSKVMLVSRLDESRQALAASEEAFSIAGQRYQGGLSTYLDVLTAQQGVLQGRRTVADLEARAFTLDIALVRALGGGFSTPDIATLTKDRTHG
jgi:NodT family efflux transporter outer membrane factor (OMF) lipoprotein